ncbi:hypothetical protein [Extensimonas vulgaris]|jgi:hypothetical protein|uniref:Uncharacterized protein n=1 Tax=Extensimonas vulgaris TaxID=1031594 RepID=A0A369AGR5_9BURK|nr:hypothetical protein [Extensimonas vulgaris]RCX08552.1 hypothetical protein DFR45_10852 [Extensimonas vulgaris]TWI39858.1 hypothetical protein IP95_01092 [Extensimonas vulgaris]
MSNASHAAQPTDHESADPAEEVTSVVPIVLPIVGAIMMFLLAFIAVSMT